MFTLPDNKLNNSYVSSSFYILLSKHYILSRETSMINPSGYETHTSSSIFLIGWRRIGVELNNKQKKPRIIEFQKNEKSLM